MTTPPASFGQTLAFAERSMTAVLRHHLAERRTAPETWYALQLIARHGPGLAREELSRDLAGAPSLDAASTRELLAQLQADGLIRGAENVELTPAGQDLHHSLRDYIAIPTTRLLSQFDPADIATTMRTLQTITKLAEDGLAS